MSYTPGPWELAMSADGCFILFGPKGRKLLTIPLDEQNEEKAANARLIAAAPELYEMLSEVLSSIERVACGGENAVRFRAEWVEDAKAALAKARGEEGEENA